MTKNRNDELKTPHPCNVKLKYTHTQSNNNHTLILGRQNNVRTHMTLLITIIVYMYSK